MSLNVEQLDNFREIHNEIRCADPNYESLMFIWITWPVDNVIGKLR